MKLALITECLSFGCGYTIHRRGDVVNEFKKFILLVNVVMSAFAFIASVFQTSKIKKGAEKAMMIHLLSLLIATLFSFFVSRFHTNKIIKAIKTNK